jgi:hypothetical protein
MADNYLQFSAVLPRLTEAEEAWLKGQLQLIKVFGDREYAEEGVPAELADQEADWEGARFLRNDKNYNFEWDQLGFEYAFCPADEGGRDGWGRHLWLYAEEWGNPDHVAWLIRGFLQKFRPTECWSMTYATTCSRPRVGEFGGGAVFVTAKRVVYLNAENWAADRVTSWKRKNPKKTKTRYHIE